MTTWISAIIFTILLTSAVVAKSDAKSKFLDTILQYLKTQKAKIMLDYGSGAKTFHCVVAIIIVSYFSLTFIHRVAILIT